MEVERESLRARQLRARDLLRGDLEGRDLEEYVEERLLTTTLENVLNWGRSNAIFPMTFDFAGSLNEPIHAGQLIDIAAVPCNRCAPTSSALKLA